MIDVIDLRPMKASEMKLGGVFYLKNQDNSFSSCQIFPEEIGDPVKAAGIRRLTEQYSREGRLYVRLNKPFQSFA